MTTRTHAPRTGRYVAQLMGMPISLALRGRHTNDSAADAAWAEVVTELRWVDRVFSTWRSDSAASRLARREITVTDCPPAMAEVIRLGELAESESGGAFTLMPAGVFDPTGVVKGWAVERAARHLRVLDETDYCLGAGGDLTCLTRDQGHGATPWQVGIEDPADATRLIATVPIFTGAVATSGTTHRGSHLVDARTGLAPTGVASVTVIAASLTWADIDATAAYAMGARAADWLSTRPDRNFFVVWPDGTTTIG